MCSSTACFAIICILWWIVLNWYRKNWLPIQTEWKSFFFIHFPYKSFFNHYYKHFSLKGFSFAAQITPLLSLSLSLRSLLLGALLRSDALYLQLRKKIINLSDYKLRREAFKWYIENLAKPRQASDMTIEWKLNLIFKKTKTNSSMTKQLADKLSA